MSLSSSFLPVSMDYGRLVLLLKQARAFFLRAGANVAGAFWNTGNLIQFALGAVVFSPRILISSVFNIGSSSASMLFGHKDWGVMASCLLGMAGTGLFLLPGLVDGSGSVVAGYLIYCIAASFGAWGAPLVKRFRSSSHAALREIFGRPRRTMGTILVLSRLPIIAAALIHQEWTMLVPFVVWALGDISIALSGEEAAQGEGV